MADILGIHIFYELYDCDCSQLNQVDELREMLLDAVRSVSLEPLEVVSHRYHPQGASVVILISESHITIHTWPEHGYAAVDLFSCRLDVDPNLVGQVLDASLNPSRSEIQIIERGLRQGR